MIYLHFSYSHFLANHSTKLAIMRFMFTYIYAAPRTSAHSPAQNYYQFGTSVIGVKKAIAHHETRTQSKHYPGWTSKGN